MYAIRDIVRQQDGLITAAQCRQAGMTRDEVHRLVRGGYRRAARRGVYLVDSDIRAYPGRRGELRAALLACGPQAVLVGTSAAELHGLAGFGRDSRIHVSMPGHHARPRAVHAPQVVPHQLALASDQAISVDGMPVTTVLRTVADLLLVLDRLNAVAVLDAVVHDSRLPERSLALLPSLLKGRRGTVGARRALTLTGRPGRVTAGEPGSGQMRGRPGRAR